MSKKQTIKQNNNFIINILIFSLLKRYLNYKIYVIMKHIIILIKFHSLIGGIPRFSIAAAAAGMAQYLSQNQGAPLKSHAGHMVDRTHLYWPGLQGLVANPMAWRERLSNTSK